MVGGRFNQIKQGLTKSSPLGLPMGFRLFLFLVVLVVTMVLGVIVILLLTGTVTAGINESEKFLKEELGRNFNSVSEQYDQLSAQAVKFSKDLSVSIEGKLRQKGLTIRELENHPEILEGLLLDEYKQVLFSLQKSKSSGVFIILNGTINPKAENAKNSRAGLFIKNMEPNILSASSPTIHLLRGFPNIARQNSIQLSAQWRMEFDISDAPYYQLPQEQAAKKKLPLSRLYHWTSALTLPGTSEEVMLCSVPLLDSQGNAFGVCGFEVSAMLFKLAQMPDSSKYNRIFCMLAPMTNDVLDTSRALFSGGYSARNSTSSNQSLKIRENRKSFFTYNQDNGDTFLGFHLPVELYPKDSPFSEQKCAVALMVPEKDIRASINGSNLRLAFMGILLIIIGIFISLFLSRYYIRPITKGFDLIKTNELSEDLKTNVPEIDDLIEFLSIHNEELLKKTIAEEKEEELPSLVINEFLKNIKTLSPAERAVFNLYVQQYTAKEIAGILCLSINTIKTHNKRIYAKLNVASREELLLYLSMLKEAGKELK